MATYRSRLSKAVEKKTKKSLVFSLLGIIVITGLLVKFGVPFLVNLAVFVSGSKESSKSSSFNTQDFIASPILNSIPDATNSAKTIVSGSALPDMSVKLYINDNLVDTTNTDEQGLFSFGEVKLSKGENTIKALVESRSGKESNPSNLATILFKDDPPSLSVDNPKDGQTFSKDENNVNVSGKTDSGAKITVNDYWAVVDVNGNFSYNLRLKDGENPITIKAVDQAGNTTETKITVSYSF